MRRATTAVLSLLVLMPAVSSNAQTEAPAAYLCNLGAVRLTGGGGMLSVRELPRTDGRVLARLPNSASIYICDETRSWYKIHYGQPGSPCGARLKGGIALIQASGCESGWVSKRFVEVLSG
jgi:hypothetical protein